MAYGDDDTGDGTNSFIGNKSGYSHFGAEHAAGVLPGDSSTMARIKLEDHARSERDKTTVSPYSPHVLQNNSFRGVGSKRLDLPRMLISMDQRFHQLLANEVNSRKGAYKNLKKIAKWAWLGLIALGFFEVSPFGVLLPFDLLLLSVMGTLLVTIFFLKKLFAKKNPNELAAQSRLENFVLTHEKVFNYTSDQINILRKTPSKRKMARLHLPLAHMTPEFAEVFTDLCRKDGYPVAMKIYKDESWLNGILKSELITQSGKLDAKTKCTAWTMALMGSTNEFSSSAKPDSFYAEHGYKRIPLSDQLPDPIVDLNERAALAGV